MRPPPPLKPALRVPHRFGSLRNAEPPFAAMLYPRFSWGGAPLKDPYHEIGKPREQAGHLRLIPPAVFLRSPTAFVAGRLADALLDRALEFGRRPLDLVHRTLGLSTGREEDGADHCRAGDGHRFVHHWLSLAVAVALKRPYQDRVRLG
jgi:hypothetical protein